MKNFEIYNMFRRGIRPVLECTIAIDDIEADPNCGMRGRLINVVVQDPGSEAEYLEFIMDFGEFEELNKTYAVPNFYSSESIPNETWFQQLNYEKNKHSVYIYGGYSDEIFRVVENNVFSGFLKDESEDSYVSWLENKVKNFKSDIISKISDRIDEVRGHSVRGVFKDGQDYGLVEAKKIVEKE